MHSLLSSIVLALTITGFGLPAALSAGQQKQSAPSGKAVTVEYCALLHDPQSYDGQLIRVKAIYTSHFETSALRDADCTRDFLWTWVDFAEEVMTGTKPEVLQSFQSAVRLKSPEQGEEDLDKAEVVFVGRFEVATAFEIKDGYLGKYPDNGYGHLGMYRFRLIVHCIEEVKALPTK